MMPKIFTLATLFAAFGLSACDGGEPIPGDEVAMPSPVTAPTPVVDQAAPASPPCHDLTLHTELSELPLTDSGHVIFNNRCLAACTNVAGGWTCILPGGVTTYCDACQ